MISVAHSTSLRTPFRHLALVVLAAWLLQLGAGAVGALPSLDRVEAWPSYEGINWSRFVHAEWAAPDANRDS
jgi:hypothetical protein